MIDQSLTRYFKTDKFEHPEVIKQTALELLDEVRHQYGKPLVVTDSGRVRGEPLPVGAVSNSLHYEGQAFDLRIRDMSSTDLWKFVEAVYNVANWVARGQKSGVEFELVWSDSDKHAHIGFYLGQRSFNTFIVRAE